MPIKFSLHRHEIRGSCRCVANWLYIRMIKRRVLQVVFKLYLLSFFYFEGTIKREKILPASDSFRYVFHFSESPASLSTDRVKDCMRLLFQGRRNKKISESPPGFRDLLVLSIYPCG